MLEILFAERGYCVRDGAEIVDDRVAVDTQPLLDQLGPDYPGIVGELEDVPADRSCKGNGQLIGQLDAGAAAELPPGELKAAMLGGLERDRLAEGGNPPAFDLG